MRFPSAAIALYAIKSPQRSIPTIFQQECDRLVFDKGSCLVPADFIHLVQRFLEIVAVRIFKIVNCQKYLVTRRPDPLQVEMRFGKDARGN